MNAAVGYDHRQVVEEKAQLPGGALGGSFGAREPSTGKHVKALAD